MRYSSTCGAESFRLTYPSRRRRLEYGQASGVAPHDCENEMLAQNLLRHKIFKTLRNIPVVSQGTYEKDELCQLVQQLPKGSKRIPLCTKAQLRELICRVEIQAPCLQSTPILKESETLLLQVQDLSWRIPRILPPVSYLSVNQHYLGQSLLQTPAIRENKLLRHLVLLAQVRLQVVPRQHCWLSCCWCSLVVGWLVRVAVSSFSWLEGQPHRPLCSR